MVPCRSRSMQSSGRQERVKASTSNISLGDNRIPTFATSYGRDFRAPFNDSVRRHAHATAVQNRGNSLLRQTLARRVPVPIWP